MIRHAAGEAKLRESGVMEVDVVDIPADSTVVDIRRMGQLSGLKSGVCGRRSDYLVVTGEEERDRAVFVELKKTLGESLSDGMDNSVNRARSWTISIPCAESILAPVPQSRKS